jgi:hypothetical protein
MFRLFRPEISIPKMLTALAFLSKVGAQHSHHAESDPIVNSNAAIISMAATIIGLSICVACCRIHCRGNQQNNDAQAAEVVEQAIPDLEAQRQITPENNPGGILIAPSTSFIGAGQAEDDLEAQQQNNEREISTTHYTRF